MRLIKQTGNTRAFTNDSKYLSILTRWLLVTSCLVFSIVANSQVDDVATSSIQKSEQHTNLGAPIRIAIVKDNPPFSLVLPSGRQTGLYVEIWKEWSKVTKHSVIFVAGNYAENIRALKSGDVDFHAGLFINKERLRWAIFSSPIDEVSTKLFYDREIESPLTMNDMKGKFVHALKGTYQEVYLRENYPEINIDGNGTTKQAVQKLLAGKIQGVFGETAAVQNQVAELGVFGSLSNIKESTISNSVHATMLKNNIKMRDLVNQGIAKLPIDRIIELEKKWMPNEPQFFNKFKTSLVPDLTLEQQSWLDKHKHLKLGVDPSWEPFEFFNSKGEYSGISSEFVKIVADRLSLEMEPVRNLSWTQVISEAKKGEIDILPGVAKSPEREKYLLFTDSYISFPNVVVTRDDAEYIQNFSDLNGRKVSVVKDYVISEMLQRNYKDIDLNLVENLAAGLKLVSDKKVFAYVDNLAVVTNYINSHRNERLKVAVFSKYEDTLYFGVRKELAPLVPILNKAFESISAREKKAITNSWLSVHLNVGTDPTTVAKWVIPILLVLFAIIMFVLRSNAKLNGEINRRIVVEKQLEVAMNSAKNANQQKSDFLANMSHEIRTPMNAVLGMTHLLKSTKLSSEQNDYVESLNLSSQTLLGLINNILDLSKVEDGKLELENKRFSISSILSNIFQQMRIGINEQKLTLYLNLDSDLPEWVKGDALRLGQILTNLTSNAIKFTERGEVTISAKVKSSTTSKIIIEFCVKDTGIGMNASQINRLFKTYSQADTSTTRKFGGTGLGLSISKNLTELMHGRIWVNSELGKGSQFYFTAQFGMVTENENLRLEEGDKAFAEKDSKRIILQQLKGKAILVVDDNLINQTIAKKMLVNSGANVTTASNGKEAIANLADCNIDCILMDIQMPIMDGFEATQRILSNDKYRTIPIIGLSANVMPRDFEKAISVGMVGYLGKPINLDAMLEMIAKHI